MATVLTVILNWRTPEMSLRSCAAALDAMQGVTGAIMLVDNDSGDGSFEAMQAEVAARGWDKGVVPVRVLQSGRNGGFGAGNNYGILAGLPPEFPGGTRPDYVYVLNSDAFPEPEAILRLHDHLEAHPQTGFAGSFIKGEDGVPHHTVFRFPSALGELEGAARFGPISRLLRRHIVAMPIPDQSCRADWMAGASVMMRQDMLDRIGLFDEEFFLYYEETDLFLRGARAGWTADYVRSSVVVHIGSVTTGMKTWTRIPTFWLDSRRHYFTKNHGHIGFVLATLAQVAGGAFWRLRLLVQRKDRGDPPHFLRDLILHHMGRRGRNRAGATRAKN
ncbi:glycosyltransferase [Gemmobacter serpentinus]|uniref:glycosyltransferase n=1 Tax=Gemmobacter serpentinus TaxID=2652247 RepID=UPI00124F270B|nr:glycosyltransferase family 2 protein [Gemmobacter serpentinus]